MSLNQQPLEPGNRDPSAGSHVLLYDGECGLCQFTVRWLLRHDRDSRLLFAPQHQPFAAAILARHGLDAEQLNSAVLVSNRNTPHETLTLRSDSILGCLALLSGPWRLVGTLARLVPSVIRDALYRLLARHRRTLFAAPVCPLPTPEERARFVEA